METGYRVVVLLSAYNGEKYIKTQIDSIFDQTGIDNLSLIIRNDGSTDSTWDILCDYRQNNDNVIIINGSNIGHAASFFLLLDYAVKQGFDYYSFSDQDDYWFSDKLRIAIDHFAGMEKPCLYASCSMIADERLISSGMTTQKKIRDISFFNTAIQNFCPGHNQVINHKLAEIIVTHPFDSVSVYSSDLWVTNSAVVSGKIVFDNTPHILYRQHATNRLSYGRNRLFWLIDRIKRLHNDEGKMISRQLNYFRKSYEEYLNGEEQNELNDFFCSQASFSSRLNYAIHSKLYRQKKIETVIFKLLYICGGYK